MARQTGTYTFSGRLGDVVGYGLNGGDFLRMVGRVPYQRWKTARGYARSRENAVLFGGASMMASQVYSGFSLGIRRLCGGYAHNAMTSQLIKARNLVGQGRLPELFPAELAAMALLRMELGPKTKALGAVVARLRRSVVGNPGLAKRLAVAERTLKEAEAKRFCHAWLDTASGRLQVVGLALAAERMPLKAKERLEFRVHAEVVGVAGVELEAKAGAGSLRKYVRGHTDGKHVRQVTDWMRYSEEEFGDGYSARLRVSGEPCAVPRLVVVAVEWRAVRGGRFRKLEGASIVRLGGVLRVDQAEAIPVPVVKKLPRRLKGEALARRRLLIRDLLEKFGMARKGKKRKIRKRKVLPLPKYVELIE